MLETKDNNLVIDYIEEDKVAVSLIMVNSRSTEKDVSSLKKESAQLFGMVIDNKCTYPFRGFLCT